MHIFSHNYGRKNDLKINRILKQQWSQYVLCECNRVLMYLGQEVFLCIRVLRDGSENICYFFLFWENLQKKTCNIVVQSLSKNLLLLLWIMSWSKRVFLRNVQKNSSLPVYLKTAYGCYRLKKTLLFINISKSFHYRTVRKNSFMF